MINADDIKNLFVPILSQPMSLEDLVARIANVLAGVAGVIAFFYLLYAGILYITAGNSPDQAKRAQLAIVNVVIGILVIALSYLIIRTIGTFAGRIIP